MADSPENHPIFRPDYWDSRYVQGQTGWDMGTVSPPLQEYCAQLLTKSLQILIPGGGSSRDAGQLYREGFSHVFVLDWSQTALKEFQQNFPDFPSPQLLQGDFFQHTGQYDLILEQTFFCALPPARREDYAKHMHALLKPGGTLAGVMFDFPLTEQGPPFGGSQEEYRRYFEPYFEIETMERCHNSIPPRAGKELFVILKKPKN